MNYPVYGLLEWHLIGYEEYIRGHNALLKAKLLDLVPDYHTQFNNLRFRYAWFPQRPHVWPPNTWHFGGCEEAHDRWLHSSNQEKAQPLDSYLTTPYIQGYRPDLQGSRNMAADKCDWCGVSFKQGVHVADLLQEHVFCTAEHAVKHRAATIAAWPEVQELYATYSFQSLPVDPLRMKRYFEKLPNIRSDQVRHTTITLPQVKRQTVARQPPQEPAITFEEESL